MTSSTPREVRLSAEEAEALGRAVLIASGVPERDARIVAGCLVRADLRGVDTHGLVRLPGYLERISRGLLDPAPTLEIEPIAPVAAALDGKDGFGFVTATRAMEAALAMAETHGIGLVGVRNSTHFGMAASYLLQALEADHAALAFTNASRALPPWGGKAELFGTSPFGVAFPGDPPFLLDMAPTIVARGKIRKAAREDRPIPEGWALDAEGRPTTDAAAALAGVLLPIGGPKGAALSMMMDIFGGLFTGARFAGEVGNQYADFERPQGVGHLFVALRPDLFLPRDEIAARMAHLAATVKASPKAKGVDEILMPGEPEARTEAVRRRDGIPYRRDDLAPLLDRAREAGLDLPGALR